MDRHGSVRIVTLAVPSQPQGSRPQLVGHTRDTGSPPPGDVWSLPPRAAPHVFGILAVGPGASSATAELDRGTFWHSRIWNLVFPAHRVRGGADDRHFRRRLPQLQGPNLAYSSRNLLIANQAARAIAAPAQKARESLFRQLEKILQSLAAAVLCGLFEADLARMVDKATT